MSKTKADNQETTRRKAKAAPRGSGGECDGQPSGDRDPRGPGRGADSHGCGQHRLGHYGAALLSAGNPGPVNGLVSACAAASQGEAAFAEDANGAA